MKDIFFLPTDFSRAELTEILHNYTNISFNPSLPLFQKADTVRRQNYGTSVYFRGLIEVTNHCKNGCYYCGINRENTVLSRYRLTNEQILACAETAYKAGLRTIVMQGGEDPYFTDTFLCNLIDRLKNRFPDIAVTLSLGERSMESYKALYSAGADRYLLRHETAEDNHYCMLHPSDLSLSNRIKCLFQLKNIGYQVGAGFMVGSPGQSFHQLVSDLLFLKELQPEMVGIGPFIPHKDTRFRNKAPGSLDLTLVMVALTRLLLPTALIPATTALGTLNQEGQSKAFQAGANVLMPNFSPIEERKLYSLYNKKGAVADTASILPVMIAMIRNAGYTPDFSIGHHAAFKTKHLID